MTKRKAQKKQKRLRALRQRSHAGPRSSWRALYEKGLDAWEAHDLVRAQHYFEESLATHPTAEAHTKLGIVWHTRNQFSEAEKEFRAALALRPSHLRALNGLGLA